VPAGVRLYAEDLQQGRNAESESEDFSERLSEAVAKSGFSFEIKAWLRIIPQATAGLSRT